nr:MAG TPA: hypothetical protein [Caudoviricetes sp.]
MRNVAIQKSQQTRIAMRFVKGGTFLFLNRMA